MIPKIIHQIWIGPNPEPTIWTNTFKNDYLAQYPHYEYKLWNETNIDTLFVEFPNIKIIYDLEPTWNGKSDLLRYLILYYYGGIYIDADSVWLNNKNFDSLIDASCGFFAANDYANSITGGVIGSFKGNKVFINILKHIESYIISRTGIVTPRFYLNKRTHHGVCKVIGPIIFNHFAKDEPITLFPTHYFYPLDWHGITDDQYHLNNNLPKDSFTFQFGYSTNKLVLANDV
jgi:inositol phosphorylceramide mannosyltransferase catalytic subunit